MLALCRRILCVAFGFAITKADIFPVMASRGAGQIILVRLQSLLCNIFLISFPRQQITLPCLMFSKIVPAFSLSNIAALGASCGARLSSFLHSCSPHHRTPFPRSIYLRSNRHGLRVYCQAVLLGPTPIPIWYLHGRDIF